MIILLFLLANLERHFLSIICGCLCLAFGRLTVGEILEMDYGVLGEPLVVLYQLPI